MCANCIRTQVDITEGLPKQLTVTYCKSCGRYNQPPNHWVDCELESRELLQLCLKKVRGLNKVRLIDASFVWTEPHSRRIKVKLTIQKEVFTGTILQQAFVVEYVVHTFQCPSCQAVLADIGWAAVVQVRQRASHKRTFFWLEQLILKYNAHVNTINVKEFPEGLDFYFGHRNHAHRFNDFLQEVIPCQYHESKKLISHDIKTNTYNYKYTYNVEIVPICKDDLVFLPRKLAAAMGNMSQLGIVSKVTNRVQVLDPITMMTGDVASGTFFKEPFRSIASGKKILTEYIVLDIEPVNPSDTGKWVLADAQIARSSDFGVNDTQYHTRTHLGRILKPGDLALGYDMNSLNINEEMLPGYEKTNIPDVLLVKKFYPSTGKRSKRRKWKLASLSKEKEEQTAGRAAQAREAAAEADYEEFLEDIEEDVDMRQHVNLYKDEDKLARAASRATVDGDDDELPPEVALEDMLDNLAIEEGVAPEDEQVDGDDDDVEMMDE